MAQPARETIASSLFKSLTDLYQQDGLGQGWDFRLRRLEKDADELVKVFAAAGYIVKAGIAALREQKQETMRLVANAVKNAPADVVILMNASIALGRVGLYEEAYEHIMKSFALAPSSEEVYVTVSQFLHKMGRIDDFVRVSEIALSKNIKNKEIEPRMYAMREVRDTLLALGVSPDRVKREVEAARTILTACHRHSSHSFWKIERDPETLQVAVTLDIRFKGTAKEAVEMECALAAQAEDWEDWDPATFSVQFQPLRELEHEHHA